jgi:hypothetical protein
VNGASLGIKLSERFLQIFFQGIHSYSMEGKMQLSDWEANL